MKPWDVIASLEAVSGRLDKEAILANAIKNCPEFFVGARLAYDGMVTFGVKMVPTTPRGHGTTTNLGRINPKKFEEVADALQNRRLTGHAARDAIQVLCNMAEAAEWNDWYRRILIKDFKCGVTDTLINKVVKAKGRKDLMIPVFECQLAANAVDTEGQIDESLLVGKKMIDVKMDGVRCLSICYPDGNVVQLSRNGKEFFNFGHIKEQLSEHFTKTIGIAWVLDAEVMSASFQDLMKQARRKSNVKTSDAILNLFDAIPFRDFMNGSYSMSQAFRRKELERMFNGMEEKMPNVRVLGFETVDFDTQSGRDAFKKINRQAIAGGYEGIMVKDPKAPYRCKRSKDWLKIKPFIEVTLQVVKMEKGSLGTKNYGILGALVCRGEDEGREIEVNVGSGFTDVQRNDFWNNPKSVVGRLIEVRGDALTKSENGKTWSIRFPRFKCFRGTKVGEKL